MTPEEFCRWLKGYAELAGDGAVILTAVQWKIVKDHLNLVYNKVTPERRYEPITLPNLDENTKTLPYYPHQPFVPTYKDGGPILIC